jgi:ubiquinone/menaquinone biosynthesis C-methylase UbiE/tetratricopeptide (TPR) repeat protein
MQNQANAPSLAMTAEALVQQAREHLARQDHEAAWKCLEESLAIEKTAAAYRNLGNICHMRQESQRAIAFFEAALKTDPGDHAALAMLAEAHCQAGNPLLAIGYSASAIRAQPGEIRYKERFVGLFPGVQLLRHSPEIEQVILDCLKTEELDSSGLQALWHNSFQLNPAFRPLYRVTHGAGPGDNSASFPRRAVWTVRRLLSLYFPVTHREYMSFDRVHFDNAADYAALLQPFFLLGIGKLGIYNIAFEKFLVHLRHRLLLEEGVPALGLAAESYVKLAVALARYCFYTEYIFDTTSAELIKVSALREAIEAGGEAASDARLVALFACYAPLYKLSNAAQVAANFSGTPDMDDLVRTQITDYFVLQDGAKAVEAITPIDAGLSAAVREQYEEFPYPSWKTLPKNLAVEKAADPLRKKGTKILIAGCGTGSEAVQIATVFPEAEILAVDLSRASLSYATAKAREFGAGNVSFRQGDLLRLGEVLDPASFDCITCCGVLVCVDDPLAAWESLCRLLKPGGIMRIGLYSKIARRHITAAQNVIRRDGHTSTAEGMKAFRKAAPELLDHAVFRNISGTPDYFHLSMLRDMLFHVKEICFDLPEIAGMLDKLGLEFLQFSGVGPLEARYRKMFPGDPGARDLGNWHAFEQANPDAFIGMYQFWCRKKH